ncbi:retroviral-like aspartic protease family protein [Asaia astilbis]|uniref:retroviral-like aspartic protease family protein n=1 Tax=Asaia astilbis TaxID=610244 RepID=UPI0004717E5A|nr:retroviral-like aspartic protease family protein [Asaia astilbis]
MKTSATAFKKRSFALLPLILAASSVAGCDAPVKDGSCTIGTIGKLPLFTTHNVPVVRATINKQPVLFVVDTGAFNSVLSERLAKRFDLTYAAATIRTTGVKGTEMANIAQVDDIGLGGATNTNHAFALTSMEFEASKPPLPPLVGILGAEILLASDLVIDLPNHNMQLLDMQRCPYPAPLWKGIAHKVPIERNLDDMKIHLQFKLNGSAPLKAIFDTGSSRITLPLRYAHRLGITDEMLKHDHSTTDLSAIGDDKVTAYHHRFETMTLGDFTIRDADVTIIDTDTLEYALFGADFLSQHRVWITTKDTMYVQHISEIQPDERPLSANP